MTVFLVFLGAALIIIPVLYLLNRSSGQRSGTHHDSGMYLTHQGDSSRGGGDWGGRDFSHDGGGSGGGWGDSGSGGDSGGGE